jgi:hypothetical protein
MRSQLRGFQRATRISIFGLSAGGLLAMLAAYSMGVARLPPSYEVPKVAVKSAVNLYTPADFSTVGFPHTRARSGYGTARSLIMAEF